MVSAGLGLWPDAFKFRPALHQVGQELPHDLLVVGRHLNAPVAVGEEPGGVGERGWPRVMEFCSVQFDACYVVNLAVDFLAVECSLPSTGAT